MKRPAHVEVLIRNLAFGGEGVGEVVAEVGDEQSELLGITAFVPYAAVGERVRARVEERKKNHLRCEAGELLTVSPDRVTAPCPVFSSCGGCHFQHLSSEAQAEAKRTMLVGALRAARLSHTVIQSVRPLSVTESYGYRRRLRLHVDANGRVGFYQPRSRVVVPIQDCIIADAAIRQVLAQLPALAPTFAGVLGSILLESDELGVLASLVAPFSMNEAAARQLLQTVRAVLPNCSISVAGKEIASSGRRLLQLELPEDCTLAVPAGGFTQANWSINTLLIRECLSHLRTWSSQTGSTEKATTDPVYDLYAGAGNFTLPIAKSGRNVIAVEHEPSLVRWGQEAVKQHGLEKRVNYFHSSVEAYLKKHKLPKGSTVLADPPRSGLGPLVQELNSASHLLFISCHLPSFVRDLKQLLDLGWTVSEIRPFDMFPQTTHMEILGVLSKP